MRNISELDIRQFGRSSPRPAPTSEAYSSLEELMGVELPVAYVRFLNHSNGGSPMVGSFSLNDQEWEVDTFFYLSSREEDLDDADNLIWQARHRSPEMDPAWLPIASDPTGNIFYMDLSQQGESPIFIWLHDLPSENLRTAKSSFEEFIDSLD